MPELTRDSVVRIVAGYLVAATQNFLADDVPRLAAAMSYFLLLALAPMILLANVALQVLGLLTGRTPVGATAPTVASAGAAASQGFAQAAAWAGSYAPWVIGILVVVGALSVFGQFVSAVDVIWKTPPRTTAVRAFVRRRGVALALLGVAAGALVVAFVVAGIVGILAAVALSYAQSLGVNLPSVWASNPVRAAVVFVASALLFVVGFVVAPDRSIRWTDAIPGALVTAVLFVVGQQLLSLYLGTTQRFVIFGASQFFVALTVWIYYEAMVVLGGVELTRVMVLDAEARRGESVHEEHEPAVDRAAEQPAAD